MTKLLALLALASGCYAHTRVRAPEPPDPIVGDMRCAPPMSIHDLLETMDHPVVAIDADSPICPA